MLALPGNTNDDDTLNAIPSALTYYPDPSTICSVPPTEISYSRGHEESSEHQLAPPLGLPKATTKPLGKWQHLLSTYYLFFHPTHPFLLPYSLLASNKVALPDYLKTIMALVACQYVPDYPQESLYAQASAAFLDTSIREDGFKVQALYIWAMVLWSRYEVTSSVMYLQKAVDLVLQLEMDRAEFSVAHGRGIPQLEESWRRTWWDIYSLDAVVSILTLGGYETRLLNRKSDVPLPCEEDVYQNNKPIPPPRTFQELQAREFADEEYEYSSFAYRIEAARLWGSSLLCKDNDVDDRASVLDISVAHYFVSLPPSKRTIEEHDGKVDEMLFSAHMLINCALISLHKPLSDLALVENNHPTICSQVMTAPEPVLSQPEHTSKAIRAANAIMHQTALPTALFFHCPSFMCALIMAASVYIPAYALENRQERLHVLHERLQLAVGALRTLGEVWPIAKAARAQIAAFARDTLYEKDHAVAGESTLPGDDVDVSAGNEWLRSMQEISGP